MFERMSAYLFTVHVDMSSGGSLVEIDSDCSTCACHKLVLIPAVRACKY